MKKWWHFLGASILCAMFACYQYYSYSKWEAEGAQRLLPKFEIIAYDLFGKWGVVAVWGGISAICAIAGFLTLRESIEPTEPDEVEPKSEALLIGDASCQSGNCASCKSHVGTEQLSWDEFVNKPKSGVCGYQCQRCGAIFCEKCKKDKLGFSWWAGWQGIRCSICGCLFGPSNVILK